MQIYEVRLVWKVWKRQKVLGRFQIYLWNFCQTFVGHFLDRFETILSKTRSSGTVTCDGSPDDSSDSSTIRAEDVLDMPFIVRLWLQKADQVGTDQGIIRNAFHRT